MTRGTDGPAPLPLRPGLTWGISPGGRRGTDGPSPLPLTPGILYLDRGQSLEACAETARLLEEWLSAGRPGEPDGARELPRVRAPRTALWPHPRREDTP